MLFIMVWKVASKFARPKNMTTGSYDLMCVVNDAFHLSPSFILTLLYPYLRSIFVNTFLVPILSTKPLIKGEG